MDNVATFWLARKIDLIKKGAAEVFWVATLLIDNYFFRFVGGRESFSKTICTKNCTLMFI
jgi:hypothetical protein